MAAYWAVEGAELNESAASITSSPENVKAGSINNSKKVYAGSMAVSISGYQSSGITDGNGVGSGSISGSSVVKINGKNIVLEGDSTTVTVSGTSTKGTTVTPVVENVTVKVKSAGQSEVSSN